MAKTLVGLCCSARGAAEYSFSFVYEMARRFKKRTRKIVRRGVRKTRSARRPRARRGRARVQVKRLGSRFPLGQRAVIKLSYTAQGQLQGNEVTSWITSSPYTLNSLSTPAHNGTTDNRASKFLPSQFSKYRVKGMSYRLTATKVDHSADGMEPSYMWFLPYNYGDPANTTAPGDIGELEQVNLSKWKSMKGYIGSGETNVLSGFIPCAKLKGDREAVTDADYDGGVNIAGFWTDPTKLFNYQFGYGVTDTAVTSGKNYMSYILKTTYHVEFFDVAMSGIE